MNGLLFLLISLSFAQTPSTLPSLKKICELAIERNPNISAQDLMSLNCCTEAAQKVPNSVCVVKKEDGKRSEHLLMVDFDLADIVGKLKPSVEAQNESCSKNQRILKAGSMDPNSLKSLLNCKSSESCVLEVGASVEGDDRNPFSVIVRRSLTPTLPSSFGAGIDFGTNRSSGARLGIYVMSSQLGTNLRGRSITNANVSMQAIIPLGSR